MRKKIELLVLLLALAGIYTVSRNLEKYVQSDQVKSEQERKMDLVVIDSGHGGSDPGKVGINEVLEKDINLKISKQVEKELKNKGYQVVMTREKDQMLAGETSGNSKIKDMKARVDLINEKAPGLAVSIHQNSYHEEEIHGAQVFYYKKSEESKRIAQIMQGILGEKLGTTRQIKSDVNYYILLHSKLPTIISECGFLSNPEEEQRLCTEEYQEKVADALYCGIIEYLMMNMK